MLYFSKRLHCFNANNMERDAWDGCILDGSSLFHLACLGESSGIFKWKCSDPEVIPMDALVKSGGVGGTSSSSMQFPCWWWQTEQEFQANLECHLVFLNLACSGKEWESWTWSQCWLKKHLQNDKLSPWLLFWGVCCFIQELGMCVSWDRITNSSNKPTDPQYFMFAL